MAITPWELAAEYSKQRSNERIASGDLQGRYDIANMNITARERAADTAFGRQVALGDLSYERQLGRDEAARKFTHEENYLQNVLYKNTGRRGGRRSYVGTGRGTPTQGGGELISPQGAMDYYVNARGVPPVVAAGIVGNISAESGWDPAVWSGQRRGDNGTAGFAGQWRGPRLQALLNFARQNGHETPSAQDQLDFFLAEGSMGHDRGAQIAQNKILSAQTPEEAAHTWMVNYERPRDLSSLKHRQSAARQALADFSRGGGGGGDVAGGSTQRRYPVGGGGGGGIPTADELYAQAQAGATDTGGAPADITQPLPAWTAQDAANEGLTNEEWQAVQDRNMDIVDTQFYSSAQLGTMTQEEQDRLM